jgi:hypothetical protein
MGFATERPAGVPLKVLVLAAVGYGGLAMSITLLSLGMRAVMEIGGSCGEGGPYVWAVPACPDAAMPATLGGILGLFVFGALALTYGGRIGGAWAAAPLLGWVALFGALGWNFLDYGLFNPPEGSGVELGLVICGILFLIMAIGPLLLVMPGGKLEIRSGPAPGGSNTLGTVTLRRSVKSEQDATAALRTALAALPDSAASESERAQLAGIAASFDAAITQAAAETPMDPATREASGLAADSGEGDFSEGTQALLDRLERLGDMRDRGLLDPAEYETAKDAIMHELEGRS